MREPLISLSRDPSALNRYGWNGYVAERLDRCGWRVQAPNGDVLATVPTLPAAREVIEEDVTCRLLEDMDARGGSLAGVRSWISALEEEDAPTPRGFYAPVRLSTPAPF